MAAIKYLLLFSIIAVVNSNLVRQSDSRKEELEKYIENKKQEINHRYRLHYHVAAPVGWINDPNGFSFYKGEYHLFYQFYPYDSVWGPMHWGHATSPDLVNWTWLPTALLPDEEQCFSGSAVVDGDTLVLMYTGHIIHDDGSTHQSQYLASSTDGVNFEKFEGNPVIAAPPNGSPDFRDPKAWRHGDYWYVIIGSKTEDDRGNVLLYRSQDLINWEFLRVLGEADENMGYMWECPDFFELDGKFVLLMSPQGLEPKGDRFKNIYQTGYIIGNFNYETFEFVPEVEFQEIDFGHDFYAATTTEVDGHRYLVGWFNMWEVPHPEDVDGWAGALTIVRELKLRDGRVIMTPVDAMVELRENLVANGRLVRSAVAYLDPATEILVDFDLNDSMELLIEGNEGGDQVWLRWNHKTEMVSVDRGNDDIRQMEWKSVSSETWRIFLDASSLELFCGDGDLVFSSRVYPDGLWKVTNLSPQTLEMKAYSLKRSIPI